MPMLVTESGITIDSKSGQPLKIVESKVVTELPKTTVCKLVQYEKAFNGIYVTPSGIVTDTSFVQPKNTPGSMRLVESESTKDVMFDHEHTSVGITVTESGTITDVVAQPVKELSEMFVIVSAITIVPLVLHGRQRISTPRG